MSRLIALGSILCLCLGAALRAGTARASFLGYRYGDPLSGTVPWDTDGESGIPAGWRLQQVGPTGNIGPAQRDPAVSIDPEANQVVESYSEGGVETRLPAVASMDDYGTVLSQRTYRRLWRSQSKQTRSIARGTAKRAGGLFHVDLPVQIPKQLRGILGSGAPNIDVSGSETITLSGVSDWTVRPNDLDTEHQRQSAFPSLEMKQDLQVNLTGSIGDRIRIDVDQSSNVQTTLDNKVKLRYEGDEDDMIKSVDLGNTNLSLSGASFRQDGLFGIKTIAKLGTVDVVAIASKQDAKTETSRFTPSGEKRRVIVGDLDYVKRQYYFIADHPLIWDGEAAASLAVFKDDRIASSVTDEVSGIARLDPTQPADSTNNPEFTGSFRQLIAGTDYQIVQPYLLTGSTAGEAIPVIRLSFGLGEHEVLAVAYVDRTRTPSKVGYGGSTEDIAVSDPSLGKEAGKLLLKVIKPDIEDIDTNTDTGRFDPALPWYPVLPYEVRNYYDLSARNIAIETLNLVVRRKDASQSVDPDNVDGVALTRILGLDQRGVTSTDLPDGKVDDQFLDEETGILFFPDLHPFNPDTTSYLGTSCPGGRGGFLCLDDYSRNILRGDSLGGGTANPNVYYVKTPDALNQSRYYIDAEFKSSQQGYFLGHLDILENSEQVKVDGILQKRGTDYNLDYSTGQLTFTRAPGPEQVISVDYSFASGGIAQAKRTLLGFSTAYNPSADLSLSSSALYETRGAQELNPKLGEEPARSIVGDLAGIVTFRPNLMTRVANLIPGVHTLSQSTLNLQGNVAASKPDPNTKGEAYIDDMEGNRETSSLSLSRTQWIWSSIPLDTAGIPWSSLLGDHARIQWYNARGVQEHDLKPVLTNEEGGDNEHTVLEMNLLTPPGGSWSTTATWSGVTQAVSRVGEDFSRTRFIEIWVNDRRQDHFATKARLHIDFGRVSEDAFWQPDALPNGLLDTEDRIYVDTRLDDGEDTGLDGLMDAQEPGYDPAANPDPNGDDYFYDLGKPLDYSKINGLEGSGLGEVGARPDTEDLNLNGQPDFDNDYFEASIDLSDTSFVAVDVAREYAGHPNVDADNGWRLFRIPIAGGAFRAMGRPNWDTIKHARLWLSDMAGPTNIQIGGVELVGSRWLITPLTDSQKARDVRFEVGVRNNKDDAAIYQAPFEVLNAVGGNATQREQSLALAFLGAAPGDTLFSFKSGTGDLSGTGYTLYREARFYLHGEAGVEAQNLRAIARFGPDTVNYYEYSLPVRTGWQEVRVPLEILSRLKESSTARVRIDSLTSAAAGVRYTAVGNPSFTRITRISFGVTVFGVPTDPTVAKREVWFDDLRVADVRKDTGQAGNFALQANFADVLAVNGSLQKQDEDFFRVGAGVNRGSGFNHTGLSFATTLQMDRVVPWSGLQLPVRYSVQHSSDVPKYRTGSDVVLDATRSDLETSRSDRRTVDLTYRRTGPRRGLTKYTVDAIQGSLAYSEFSSINTQSRDSSWAFTAAGSYDVPIGGGKGIRLSETGRLKYLPEVLTFSGAWNSARTASYSRLLGAAPDSAGVIPDSSTLRSNVLTRLLTVGMNGSWIPINALTTRFGARSVRNMLFRDEGVLGWNTGTEIDYRQNLEANWTPRRFFLITPTVNLSGIYHEDSRPELKLNKNDPQGLMNIDNTGSARVSTALPFGRLGQKFKRTPAARDSGGSNFLGAPFRAVLSRLQDVQTSFSFQRSSRVTRVLGSPGSAFRTGFTEKLDPGLIRLASSEMTSSRSYLTQVNTTLQAFARLSFDIRADHRLTYSDALYGSRQTYQLAWPDVNARWQELQRALGLDRTMSTLSLTSHYNARVDEQGPEGRSFDTRQFSSNWDPLLGWNVSFRNGIRADVTSRNLKTEGRDNRSAGTLRIRTTKTHDIKLNKTYPASKGIKFPWKKTRVRLPNDVNLNLNLSLAHDKQTTERFGFEQLELDNARLNVGSGTSYNFTPSITGGFDLSFRQDKDNKAAVTRRGITIAVNSQFRF